MTFPASPAPDAVRRTLISPVKPRRWRPDGLKTTASDVAFFAAFGAGAALCPRVGSASARAMAEACRGRGAQAQRVPSRSETEARQQLDRLLGDARGLIRAVVAQLLSTSGAPDRRYEAQAVEDVCGEALASLARHLVQLRQAPGGVPGGAPGGDPIRN